MAEDYLFQIDGVHKNNEGGQLEVSTERGFVIVKWMSGDEYVYLTFTPHQAAQFAGSVLRAADHISPPKAPHV